MATKDSTQPTHSKWNLENEQSTREYNPLQTDSNILELYQSNDEFLTEDEN